MEPLRVGMLPSGNLLAFGFDPVDHSPKAALFRVDGSLLRLLEIPKEDAPASIFSEGPGQKGPRGLPAPTQLVPYRDSIIVVQNRTKFPLLQVNEAGAVHPIKPKLPRGVSVDSLIPSDGNLYVLGDDKDHSIFELSAEDGTILRRFQTAKGDGTDLTVACVHNDTFLSFNTNKANSSRS